MKNTNLYNETKITSETNRKFKEFKALLTGRGVKRYGKTIISGSKVVPELIQMKPGSVLGWITLPDDSMPPPEMPDGVPRYRLSTMLFRELDVNGTRLPLLVVKVPDIDPFDEAYISDPVILLIPFQDPRNVGAVIRTAFSFDIRTIVILKEAANPFHPKSIRAAGTPLFRANFLSGPSITDLDGVSRPIVALSKEGSDIREFVFPRKFAFLPGIEGTGLPEEVKPSHTVSIPINPHVESLNATVATSIVMYEWRMSRKSV